ncbi:hypothetical protein JJL45_06185 [Tamlana sp. s12]|uniref:hypothetical protein n=1 Tax=Tamlana sp. s12 TaxID=1630406 RepID=UPI0007FCB8F6|nr:hypothetical protein [Tamlana sp. s12]OBQ55915.1 hypothetical protein VQ01_05875 [Tamlana sp. s12]QQY83581.1 hypothetical protein JJL45_06185 [Tamlana sp. s12]
MKKITLLFVALVVNTVTFAQTISLNNLGTIGTEFYQGQTISLEIALTGIDGNFEVGFTGGPDLAGSAVSIDAAKTTAELNAFVGAFGDTSSSTNTFINLAGRTVQSGTVTLNVTVPSDFTFTGGGQTVSEFIVLTLNGGSATGNEAVTIHFDQSTLSTNNFNKDKLAAYYNASTDALVVDSKISGDYAIYNLTGKLVSKGIISNQISLNTLKSGSIYVFATKSGVLKFAK